MERVLDAHLVHHLPHHGFSGAGVRLMSGHCCGGIVQHHQCHICLIVYRVDHAGNCRRKKCGIPHESKTSGIRFNFSNALRHVDTGTHTQTGIHHVQRHGIAQRIAANIPAEYALFAFHRFFYGKE